jgi:hypothetical protein
MVNRLKIALTQDEYDALLKLATAELRSVADQARHILRHELLRIDLLTTDTNSQLTASSTEVNHVGR